MALAPVYIYALVDPETECVRYIGKTHDLKRRYKQHLTPSYLRKRRSHKNSWLLSLVARGLRPIMCVLETADTDTYAEAERRQIAAHRAAGCDLTNLTDGGDGSWGFKHRPETLAKLRALALGRVLSPAAVQAVIRANTGRVPTPETRAKLSAASKGRRLTPERIAQIVAANTGRAPTPEARAKMAAAQRGRKHTAEERAKISAANKGRPAVPACTAALVAWSRAQKGVPKSAEQRAKMAEARRQWWQRRKASTVPQGPMQLRLPIA